MVFIIIYYGIYYYLVFSLRFCKDSASNVKKHTWAIKRQDSQAMSLKVLYFTLEKSHLGINQHCTHKTDDRCRGAAEKLHLLGKSPLVL